MADKDDSSPDEYNRLMAAVGTALHGWSMVESAMGLLFNCVSGIPESRRAGAIFDTILSFEVRLAVLNTAMEWCDHFSEEEKEIWACVARRIRSLYKKRHPLAHFGFSSQQEMVKGKRISPFFSWHKRDMASEKYLTRAEISARNAKFNDAARAVTWFAYLCQQRSPQKVSPSYPAEEPELILRIRESLARSQEGAEPPPPPSPV